MKFKAKMAVSIVGVALGSFITPLAIAGDSTASTQASGAMSTASGKIVSGSVGVLSASGELIVVGVEQSANGVSVVMRSAANVSAEVIAVLIDGAHAVSVAAGQVLKVSATGVGHVLVASGKVIAFIPNEIGQSLIHQTRYTR